MMSKDPRVTALYDAIRTYGHARQQLGRVLAGDNFEKVRMWERARCRAWEGVIDEVTALYDGKPREAA